jgi:hypothetical protein
LRITTQDSSTEINNENTDLQIQILSAAEKQRADSWRRHQRVQKTRFQRIQFEKERDLRLVATRRLLMLTVLVAKSFALYDCHSGGFRLTLDVQSQHSIDDSSTRTDRRRAVSDACQLRAGLPGLRGHHSQLCAVHAEFTIGPSRSAY